MILQVIKLQDLRDRMGWLQRRFGNNENQESSEGNKDEDHDQGSSEGQLSSVDKDAANEKSGATCSTSGKVNGDTADDIVTMATNAILASGDVTIQGLTTGISETDDTKIVPSTIAAGKNKKLAHTIMRLLHDKKDNGDEINSDNNEPPELMEEYKPDDSEYYPELGDLMSHSPGGALSRGSPRTPEGDAEQPTATQQKAPSTNKRKCAPPRRCLVQAEKKMAKFDGDTPAEPTTCTEDSDVDEYK
jgi:hypothetical protein